QRSREHLEPVWIEALDDALHTQNGPTGAERTHHMAEVALRLTLIVRLGEALARECLVGYLGLAPVGVGVVDRRAVGRPFDETAAAGVRRATQRIPHPAIALRVNDDCPHAAFDRTDREPGLRDRLA